MELWIRAQDKNLLRKSERLRVVEDMGEYYIADNGDTYGIYKSQERALEVLDEIQDLMRSISDSDLKIVIYEMPKK